MKITAQESMFHLQLCFTFSPWFYSLHRTHQTRKWTVFKQPSLSSDGSFDDLSETNLTLSKINYNNLNKTLKRYIDINSKKVLQWLWLLYAIRELISDYTKHKNPNLHRTNAQTLYGFPIKPESSQSPELILIPLLPVSFNLVLVTQVFH